MTTMPSAQDAAQVAERSSGHASDDISGPLPGCTVQATDLCKTFGKRTLWQGLGFDLHAGDMVALVGPSGCGKSTLLNCLGLLERPSSGTLLIDGSDVASMNERAKRLFRKNRLGYLFQDYALIDNANVMDNLSVAWGGLPRNRRVAAAHEALEYVGLPGRDADVVYRMSGGEQQRVALARLMVKRPGLVLADEPTGALDKANAHMVVDGLRHMASQGATVVIATHSDAVAQACDRTIDLSAHHGDGGDESGEEQ
ncbi:ABC transporter ATP-binding protein [Bifidobacterium apri]|uniref:ABC transporter ATP-binding protein n=1 Tax=Bifidobacterium apri TaxID=1769423 RepID=UPI003995D411